MAKKVTKAQTKAMLEAMLGKPIKGKKAEPKRPKPITDMATLNRMIAEEQAMLSKPVRTKKVETAPAGDKLRKVADAKGLKPSTYRDDQKVTVLAKANPKKAGSEAAKRFAKYRSGLTVAANLKRGVLRDDVRYDLQRGFIAVA